MSATGGSMPDLAPLRRTPLEGWIAERIGGCDRLEPERLRAWQRERLLETLTRAVERSPFYAERLADGAADEVHDLDDLARLPFTTADDLREQGSRMLCVSPSDIERIVTLPTTGTTGSPKRVFFTPEDLERTVDFFRCGMSTFTHAGDRVLVFMPGERPGSVGELLLRAVPRLGAQVEVHGAVRDVDAALKALSRSGATVVVGIPIQMLALARRAPKVAGVVRPPRVVLLSADRTSETLREALQEAWACEVYDHYGATEMGFGGGVECEAHAGYHLREADLLFEVVSLETGQPAGPDTPGEVVVTTLTRTGMPLIRYRTGDLSHWVSGDCRCSSRLRLLAPLGGRLSDAVRLRDGGRLTLAELDELVLAVGGVVDFKAGMDRHAGAERLVVELRVAGSPKGRVADARRALLRSPTLGPAVAAGRLHLQVRLGDEADWPCSSGMVKRSLVDKRQAEETDA